jgi:hypothetical protein
MSAAVAAVHFGARHPVAAIDRRPDAALDGGKKAGPASAALELAIRDEQLLAAGRARERARPMLAQQRTGSGRLSGVIPQHRILLRRQQFAPFLIRLGDGKCRRLIHAFCVRLFESTAGRSVVAAGNSCATWLGLTISGAASTNH